MKTRVFLLTASLVCWFAASLAADMTAREKAQKVIIPELKTEEASAKQIVDILQKQAREQDPEGTGINILYRFSPAGKQIFTQESITVQLDNVPFVEVLHYIHLLTGLHYRFDKHVLLIFDNKAARPEMTTRSYNIGAGVIDSRRTRSKADEFDDWDDDSN